MNPSDSQTAYDRIQEEVEEIARVLMKEQGKTMLDVWQEALSLHRVRYESEIMPEPEKSKKLAKGRHL